jgi:hypothetical protein
MSLRFSYQPVLLTQPSVSLGGRMFRPRPLIPVTLLGPANVSPTVGLLDTGADDMVFPDFVARFIGIDLTNAPTCTGKGVGGQPTVIRFALVVLRIADNYERCEWQALVGFSSASSTYPLLGYAGFLQYFSATFHGKEQEIELAVNADFPGTTLRSQP